MEKMEHAPEDAKTEPNKDGLEEKQYTYEYAEVDGKKNQLQKS